MLQEKLFDWSSESLEITNNKLLASKLFFHCNVSLINIADEIVKFDEFIIGLKN